MGRTEGMRLHGRPGCRWKNSMNVVLKEIIWEGVK
jgi:hypothetical protein